jgi:hypothetical protein
VRAAVNNLCSAAAAAGRQDARALAAQLADAVQHQNPPQARALAQRLVQSIFAQEQQARQAFAACQHAMRQVLPHLDHLREWEANTLALPSGTDSDTDSDDDDDKDKDPRRKCAGWF